MGNTPTHWPQGPGGMCSWSGDILRKRNDDTRVQPLVTFSVHFAILTLETPLILDPSVTLPLRGGMPGTPRYASGLHHGSTHKAESR